MTSDSQPSTHRATARPARWRRLNAATVVLWRSPEVVQLELGERRITVSNVEPEHVAALLPRRSAVHTRQRLGKVDLTSDRPIDRARPLHGTTLELAEQLHRAGFLTRPVPRLSSPEQLPAYLNADLGALIGRYGDGAYELLARRRQAAVAVHGTSRITATIAATLASAGVGHVQLVDGGEVAAADACPGGLGHADEGARFGIAGVAAIRRSSPDVDTAPIGNGRLADLVILTDPAPVEPSVRDSLHLDGLPHLSSTVHGSRAVIGPLVLPGRTSCLRCADLHRCDRDPAWPALAVQLAARLRQRTFSDVALCVAAAGVTAGQALGYLDGQRPETLGGTVEWQLPDWRLRRRTWPPHHECDCGASSNPLQDGRMGS